MHKTQFGTSFNNFFELNFLNYRAEDLISRLLIILMLVSLCVSLLLCLYVCLYVWTFVYLLVCLYFFLSVSVSLFFCLSVSLSLCLSVYLFACLFIWYSFVTLTIFSTICYFYYKFDFYEILIIIKNHHPSSTISYFHPSLGREPKTLNETACTIWYHLYNLKKVKNTHGGVILLVNVQACGMVYPIR